MRFGKPKHLSWREFARRLWVEIQEDAVTEAAAQLAFYFLFSLFPFFFFLVTLAAYLPFAPGAIEAMLDRLDPLMPATALQVVEGHLESLVTQSAPRLITLGLLVALWTASRGVDAFRRALNLAYDAPEYRPYWKTQGLAILMTIAGTLLIPLAFALFLLGGRLGEWIAEHLHALDAFHTVLTWLRWPFTAALVMFVLALCYWRLPAVRHRYHFFSLGALVASVLWLFSTWGFTQYVEHFGRYNVTYGSIGGVIVLMFWLYVSGLIFILGGEINAVIEHAQAEEAHAEGRPPPLESPHLEPEAERAPSESDRNRLARWRQRRRLAQHRCPEVQPPAEVQESEPGSRSESEEEGGGDGARGHEEHPTLH